MRLFGSERIAKMMDQKLLRVKQIEDNAGHTLVSEGIDANYAITPLVAD